MNQEGGPAAPVKEGDVIAGKYRVERVLGQGGMGTVVAARHIELETRVAIKFLLSAVTKDPEAVARFQREARAAVSLKSEHSVRIIDVGRTRDGTPFMVMELLVGSDLGAVVDRHRALPVEDAVDYLLQACEAVAEAHALGIVHRDLKPQNLFLTRRVDGRPLVKVLDFGLAKPLETSALDPRALTQPASMMGSPMYMSPEQMRSSRSVDARSDIWSLGVCLYELLTGSMPFTAVTAPELCASVLKDHPRHPHELKPDLPDPLCAALLRCLEKEPGSRFRDVGALALAIAPFAPTEGHVAAAHIRAILDGTKPAVASEDTPRFDFEKETRIVEKAGARTEVTFTAAPRVRSMLSFAVVSVAVAVALSLVAFLALRRGGEVNLGVGAAPIRSSSPAPPPAVAPTATPAATLPVEPTTAWIAPASTVAQTSPAGSPPSLRASRPADRSAVTRHVPLRPVDAGGPSSDPGARF